jgi:hypothetical protein
MKELDVTQEFKSVVKDLRLHGKWLAGKLWDFRREAIALPVTQTDRDMGEVIANLTLAYRAFEDASMRLGKAVQAWDGGISVYDESTVGSNKKDNENNQ